MNNILKYIFLALLVAVASCESGVDNKRSLSTQSSSNATEVIDSKSVTSGSFFSLSEEPRKRYKSIDLIGKIINRTLGVGYRESEFNGQVKKSTGMLSYLNVSSVLINSKAIDDVSLGWFKQVRNFAARKCQTFVNREFSDIKSDNLLVKSEGVPKASDLNDIVLKALRVDEVTNSIHELASHYAPAFAMLEGASEDDLKKSYTLYCTAVFTDPLIIYY